MRISMTPSKNFDPKYKREMNGDTVDSGFGIGVGVATGSNIAITQQSQGVAALIVMLAVLCFIFAYCCWGAPFCRSFCRRHCCCRTFEGSEIDPQFGAGDQAMVATPTIILLPHGRMLVVDGTIFTQLQADTTGLDLVELGENVIRSQRNSRYVNRHQLQCNQQESILEMDAETPSKDSMESVSQCFPPPTYESIYGLKNERDTMPPSYSDIILHRFANIPYEINDYYCQDGKEDIEMQSLDNCTHIISNPLMAYHPYATITSLSGQRLTRPNISRNSSFVSSQRNVDNFYIENEFDNHYSITPPNYNRTSNNIQQQNSARVFISNEELHAQYYRDSQSIRNRINDNVFNSNENIRFNRTRTSSSNTLNNINNNSSNISNNINISTSANNDDNNNNNNNNNNDNHSRSNNISVITNENANRNRDEMAIQQASSSSVEITNIQVGNSEEIPRPERPQNRNQDEDGEDENKNFTALADIRESRV